MLVTVVFGRCFVGGTMSGRVPQVFAADTKQVAAVSGGVEVLLTSRATRKRLLSAHRVSAARGEGKHVPL